MKYIAYVREHFKSSGFPVVRLFELRTALKSKGIGEAYLKLLVNHLLKRGEFKKITKGVYTMHDDITMAGFAFQPFYYGLENALTIRRLWEQGTNPIVITTRKVRVGLRKFEGANYTIKRIDRRFFFGFDLVKYYDFWIPVSDLEKTLIDFIYFKHYLRKDVLVEMKRRLDGAKLVRYLENYPPGFKKKVLSFLNLKKL